MRVTGGLRGAGWGWSGGGRLFVNGEGHVALVELKTLGGLFLFFDGEVFEVVHLAKGFEGGAQEATIGDGLAVVDDAVGKGFDDVVEVAEDGGVVFDPGEGDEGNLIEGGRGQSCRLAAGAGADLAQLVLEAEVPTLEGGLAAAGAVDAEVAAAVVIGIEVEEHWVSFGKLEAGSLEPGGWAGTAG
ncbi:MAG TPA: hypothetical protein VGG42_05270 [Acidobacteriaceae bacterium]